MKLLFIVPNVIGLKNFFRTGNLIDEGMPSMFKPIEHFIKNKDKVTILVYPHYSIIEKEINYNKKNLIIKSLELKPEFLLSKVVRKLSFGYINLNPWAQVFFLVKQIINIKDQLDFKLIYGQDNLGVVVGYFVGKVLKIPAISRIYGASFMRSCEGRVTLLSKIKYFEKYLPLKMRTEMLIITKDGSISEDEIMKIKPRANRVNLWFNGYDKYIKNFKPSSYHNKEFDFTLISISVLSKWKNVHTCIDILNALIKKGYNWNLLIVGSGQEKNNLMKLAEEYNIINNISFTGKIKREKIYSYLNSSHVFLNFYDRQNLSNTLWEAMSMSKCVFTRSEYEINRKILSHGKDAFLFSLNDTDKIVDMLINLYSDRDLLKQVGINARNTMENVIPSWEKRIEMEQEAILNIYNKFFL